MKLIYQSIYQTLAEDSSVPNIHSKWEKSSTTRIKITTCTCPQNIKTEQDVHLFSYVSFYSTSPQES